MQSEEAFLWSCAAAVILTVLESCLETALTGINRARVRQLADDGHRRAQTLDTLLEERHRLLSMLGSLRTLTAALVGLFLALGITMAHGWAITGTAIAVLVAIVFAELLLRRLAATRAERFALALTPVLTGLGALTAAFHRFLPHLGNPGPDNQPAEKGPTEQDIRLMVEEGRDIQETEKEMIHSIFELGETIAREIMVPRVDLVAVEAKTPCSRVLDTAVTSGHSRLPVYDENIDSIVGIAYTRDLLTQLHDGKMDKPVRDCVRPAFIVHGTKKVDELLRDMQKEKVTIAVVVDEYGGTDGLITMEDLIEEIVGEIADEYDKEIPSVEKMPDGSIVVDAKMIIEDVNEALDVSIPSDDYETIGGYVYGLIGRVPNQGDTAEVDDLIITVEKVQRQRIMKIRIQKKESEAESAHV